MANHKINRVFLLVLDSVGAGSLPDAAAYGDQGADTLGHIAEGLRRIEIASPEKAWAGKHHPHPRGGRRTRASGFLGAHGRNGSRQRYPGRPLGDDGHHPGQGRSPFSPGAFRSDLLAELQKPDRRRGHPGQQGRFRDRDHRRTRRRARAQRLSHRLYFGRQRVADRRP